MKIFPAFCLETNALQELLDRKDKAISYKINKNKF